MWQNAKVLTLSIVIAAASAAAVIYWNSDYGSPVEPHKRNTTILQPDAMAEVASSAERQAVAQETQASSSVANDTQKSAPQARTNSASYVGTLNDQVQNALASDNSNEAVALAAKLKDCELNRQVMAVEGSRGATGSDAAAQAARVERIQDYQRQQSSCQTVAGDQHQLRLRLLVKGAKDRVAGAAVEAFEAGSREADVLSQLVSDAKAGDVKALTTLAIYDPVLFGTTKDTQDAARYALKVAATDPSIGKRVENYLKIAESYATPGSDFDIHKISGSARIEGDRVLNNLRSRSSKPRT